ncbi:MAG: hypothetical protein K1X94_09805 [Sandaracinaceae bacterium]|nr:hypothetical protein [Sandaracinaceae bacterium]
MRVRPVSWAFLALSCGLSGVFGLALGCESRVSLGGRCAGDAECGALRCLYGRCRAECVTSPDCGGTLECNDGVCAERTEACSASDPCTDPTQACAGTICAVRCTAEGTCDPSSECVPRVGGRVCVPRVLGVDAGLEVDASIASDVSESSDTGLDAGPPTHAITDLCVGIYHMCVVDGPLGTVRCWGVGHGGELGGGEALSASSSDVIDCMAQNDGMTCFATFTPRTVVDRAGPIRDIVELQCGERSSMARTRDGRLYSWGIGTDGQLGRDYTPPVAHAYEEYAGLVTDRLGTALEGVLGVALGSRHACAILADRTLCWGAAYALPVGQLGNGADVSFEYGALAATELGVTRGAAMTTISTCAIDATGVHCVGLNEVGVVGEQTSVDAIVRSPANAVELVGLTGSPRSIVAGSQFYCALFGDTPGCWGQGVEGALGRGEVIDYPMRCPDGMSYCDPRAEAISSPLRFDSIASGPGASTVCGTSGGRVYCWGASERGQAGSDRVFAPRDPILDTSGLPLENVRVVRVGGRTSCALTDDEALYCWGSNQWGHFRTALDPADGSVQHPRATRVPLD